MPMYLENFGIDFFKDDDAFYGLLAYLTQNGRPLVGYSGYPTFVNKQGDVDMCVKVTKEDGHHAVADLDTHCSGPHIWTMKVGKIDLTPKDALPTERLILFHPAEGRREYVPINVINADVLPSFLDGDIIRMQMTALPMEIKYYASEKEYAADQPEDSNGDKWLTAMGSFFPLQMLYNHTPDHPADDPVDYSTDDIVLFTAKVKKLYYGRYAFEENVADSFIRCYAESRYGDIVFAHTVSQVEEKYRHNIKEGAIITGSCILSGDAAIYEYENGIVKSAENALRVVRQAVVNGEAERLRPVLLDTSVYDSKFASTKPTGADAIIKWLKKIYDTIGRTVYAHPATITKVVSDELEYGIGKRCLILCYDSPDDYKSLMFVDVNDDGDITRIRVDDDYRYRFRTDESHRNNTEQ